ncbi:MAG: ketopantoate reductase family protein [Candidatus Omnitrophica bacterium]|nr:ketopantoate reductase family protein [Candidatus Omnitrophota bacterium]
MQSFNDSRFTIHDSRKKVAVIGTGAIGSLALGYLKDKDESVCGVIRPYQVEPFIREGLIIEGVRGRKIIKDLSVATKLKQEVDLAIFSTKTFDLEEAIRNNLDYLKGAYVLSTQNGVTADHILEHYFDKEKIITGIVMFGATFYPPNRVVHNFEGELILGNIFGQNLDNFKPIEEILAKAFEVNLTENIKGKKYLKLFLNLSNCIPACLGKSMQEVFCDIEICIVAIRLIKEAYQIATKSGINLESLPTYPKERIEGFVKMDEEKAAVLFSKIMTSLSKEPLYGSILQSINRKKPSEIDFINGEIIRLAGVNNLEAALNTRIIELVHRVEETRKFFTREEFMQCIGG